jgi:putative spermidine/putrescine transport system substrate-binding protein
MKKLHRTLAISIALALGTMTGAAHAQVTLNVISGGSQNMVDYVTDYLGPLFEKQNPATPVRRS